MAREDPVTYGCDRCPAELRGDRCGAEISKLMPAGVQATNE